MCSANKAQRILTHVPRVMQEISYRDQGSPGILAPALGCASSCSLLHINPFSPPVKDSWSVSRKWQLINSQQRHGTSVQGGRQRRLGEQGELPGELGQQKEEQLGSDLSRALQSFYS